MDRLGRSVRHLIKLVEQLRHRKVGFKSPCDGAVDTTTASGELVFHIFTALAQFERKRIRPGTSLRITEVGEGFYVTPVPEPTEAELAAVLKALDAGRRTRPITAQALRRGDRHAQGVLPQVGGHWKEGEGVGRG